MAEKTSGSGAVGATEQTDEKPRKTSARSTRKASKAAAGSGKKKSAGPKARRRKDAARSGKAKTRGRTARGGRVRRTKEEVVELTLARAAEGPFTPAELAKLVGFTSNRARQLLEELKESDKVVPLGARRGGRGKPATLWGLPGTELSEEDTVVQRPAKKAAPRREATARPPREGKTGAGRGFLDRIWEALELGIEIRTPEGGTYQVRLMDE